MSSVSCRDTGVGWTWGWCDRVEDASTVFVMTDMFVHVRITSLCLPLLAVGTLASHVNIRLALVAFVPGVNQRPLCVASSNFAHTSMSAQSKPAAPSQQLTPFGAALTGALGACFSNA